VQHDPGGTDGWWRLQYDVKLLSDNAERQQVGAIRRVMRSNVCACARVSALTAGTDILLEALPKITAAGGVQVAILGTGKAKYEAKVKAASKVTQGSGWGGAVWLALLSRRAYRPPL
jgi:glycogen synthase